jgi:alkanesulfonate monooxygenase SsuD/methylene tetrahydromethanopterin reductase-like flavin-dependent oxidoreductase (luciferase family)/hemerythrin-like domain-containing protein
MEAAMTDYGHELQFGVFITPDAGQVEAVLELSRLADLVGLDLVTFQDHPYQARFLDTWTLISVVAAQTTNVRIAPNVVNLPLRPPVVLARSVASLDILTGGRVELGLGAGAFWDGIAAVGGPRLTPGQSVDALAEAIDVIRAIWNAGGGTVHHEGEHYRVVGAHPGPAPAHDVELWLGAYKRRMLALTGAKADGWLPSLSYVDLADLPRMNEAIDHAAEEAGRPPADVRRLFNVNGSFGRGSGFLEGAPRDWAEQLSELALTSGMSVFILSASSGDDVRRFAEEVAPAVRELVTAERAAPTDRPAPALVAAASPTASAPFAVTPTPDDGQRLSGEQPWDETTRPTGPPPDPDRRYTPDQQAAGRHLIDVHDALRRELTQLRDLIEQVARGEAEAATARSFITRMTIRQNHWTLGNFCETYCRVVTQHHTLEDRSVFPHIQRSDPALAPVIERLEEEHETIADLLERVDQALVALVSSQDDGIEGVHRAVGILNDALLSHFSYEERELIEPLARLGFY